MALASRRFRLDPRGKPSAKDHLVFSIVCVIWSGISRHGLPRVMVEPAAFSRSKGIASASMGASSARPNMTLHEGLPKEQLTAASGKMALRGSAPARNQA
jgi:hypothetical protein